jgi:hypothetical protein
LSGPVPEGRTSEYKATLPAGTNEEKVKFLRAVSSLANTAGGDLIIGVNAPKGIPEAIPGLSGVDQDAEKLRLENLMRDGIQERIRLVQLRYVPLAKGTVALILRVPKSFSAPHRVTLGGHAHFYARNSAGAYQLDVPELRQAFLQAPTIAARIRAFREERLARVAVGDTPVPLVTGGRLVFHVVPFGAFMESTGAGLELTKQQAYRFAPPNSNSMYLVHNFDGYLVYYGGDGPQQSYVQVFRSGAVEFAMALHHTEPNGPMRVNGAWVEQDLQNTAPRFALLLHEHGIAPPYYFMLSLLSIKNHLFDTGNFRTRMNNMRADRDNMIFPEVAVESPVFDVPSTLRPIANRLWNTFGYAQSHSYDEKGNYVRADRK